VGGCGGPRYRKDVAMHGPDEDDVVEQAARRCGFRSGPGARAGCPASGTAVAQRGLFGVPWD
jgi:hypothetical protein